MNKTGIEWCDMTWNPVTGCRHGCDYCYALRISERFGTRLQDRSGYPETHNGVHVIESKINGNPYPYIFEPTFLPFRLAEPLQKRKPQNIFVCSMADLFGEWVPDDWIERVFDACRRAPQHKYLFLTKKPWRYKELYDAGLLPDGDNFWFGSTITSPDEEYWFSGIHNAFLSIEPILYPFGLYETELRTNWVIIGAETGPMAKQHRPKQEWIEAIVQAAYTNRVPVFMKDSLIPIVGRENLLREIPEILRPPTLV